MEFTKNRKLASWSRTAALSQPTLAIPTALCIVMHLHEGIGTARIDQDPIFFLFRFFSVVHFQITNTNISFSFVPINYFREE